MTGGRSGSFFLKTFDKSVILKTVAVEEIQNYLEKVVPKLNPEKEESVLVRVYGVFSIRVPGSAKEFVLIMNNVTQIPQPIYAVFDLKGSKFNRKVLRRPSASTPLIQSDTLKDKDFEKMIGKLVMSESDVNRLSKALLEDVSLLNSLKLMDYSLLVGIGEYAEQLESLPKRFRRNLFRCTNYRNRIYAISLIDFLQRYSLRKKMERIGKRLLASDIEISSIDPDRYSDRFLEMISIILA